MIEKVKSITIKGRCFSESGTTLDLFPNESNRVSIIYGVNGSGKSTIGNALNSFSKNDITSDLSAEIKDYDSRSLFDTEESINYKKRIFVYNEDFISQNVGLKSDGLSTIVLFGKQNEADLEIAKINTHLKELKEIQKDLQTKLKKTSSELENRKKLIVKKLKTTWADNDGKIRNNKKNTPVNDDIIKEIYNSTSTEDILDLRRKFDIQYKRYVQLTSEKKEFPEIKNIELYDKKAEQSLVKLLNKKLTKLSANDSDKRILEKLKKDLEHTNNLKNILSSNSSTCPFCFQPIDTAYKETLLKVIDIILNTEVLEHRNELEASRLNNYSFDVKPYESLNINHCTLICNQLANINRIILVYNSHIDEKQKSIYKPIDISSLKLYEEVKQLFSLIQELEKHKVKYEEDYKDLDSIRDELLMLNKIIALKNNESLLNEYFNFIDTLNQIKNAKKNTDTNIEQAESELRKYEEIKKNVVVSVDNINKALEYIFFSKERMKIEASEGCYIIKSKGINVKPRTISCGERNIISLCYFFAKIMENLDENDLYTRESLILIDDPVSSFDYNNRIGILSYLKQQTQKILTGNNMSRIVFLSHDLYTIDSIYKFVDEIRNNINMSTSKPIPKIASFCFNGTFEGLVLKPDNLDDRMNTYSKLLKSVYEYASGTNIDLLDFSIGNIMRRLLEAFGTFEYKRGIIELTVDPELLESIPENKRSFFENLMYRFVLHDESHSSDHVSSSDVDFYIVNNPTEKMKTAKYILCLIYALNPLHLSMRFKSESMNDAYATIKKWYNEIETL